jgi:hypothetical protein
VVVLGSVVVVEEILPAPPPTMTRIRRRSVDRFLNVVSNAIT